MGSLETKYQLHLRRKLSSLIAHQFSIMINIEVKNRLREVRNFTLRKCTIYPKEEIHKYIRKMAGQDFNHDLGICATLGSNVDLCSLFEITYLSWEEYSGRDDYPIPHKFLRPKEAFNTLKLWEGEYGQTRRKLLARFLKLLKNYLKYGELYITHYINKHNFKDVIYVY